MQQFNCPHCNHLVSDDGQLAGQLMACPACEGRFQIPSNTATAAAQLEPLITTRHNQTSRRLRRRSLTVAVVSLVALWLFVFALSVFVALGRPSSPEERLVGSWDFGEPDGFLQLSEDNTCVAPRGLRGMWRVAEWNGKLAKFEMFLRKADTTDVELIERDVIFIDPNTFIIGSESSEFSREQKSGIDSNTSGRWGGNWIGDTDAHVTSIHLRDDGAGEIVLEGGDAQDIDWEKDSEFANIATVKYWGASGLFAPPSAGRKTLYIIMLDNNRIIGLTHGSIIRRAKD